MYRYEDGHKAAKQILKQSEKKSEKDFEYLEKFKKKEKEKEVQEQKLQRKQTIAKALGQEGYKKANLIEYLKGQDHPKSFKKLTVEQLEDMVMQKALMRN